MFLGLCVFVCQLEGLFIIVNRFWFFKNCAVVEHG